MGAQAPRPRPRMPAPAVLVREAAAPSPPRGSPTPRLTHRGWRQRWRPQGTEPLTAPQPQPRGLQDPRAAAPGAGARRDLWGALWSVDVPELCLLHTDLGWAAGAHPEAWCRTHPRWSPQAPQQSREPRSRPVACFMVRPSSPTVYSEGAMAFLGDKGEGRRGWPSCRHKAGVPGLGAGLGWACKLVTRQRDLSRCSRRWKPDCASLPGGGCCLAVWTSPSRRGPSGQRSLAQGCAT